MKCFVCPDVTLVMMNRQGVEIDYCPNCRGVWLDRGELDKLIELAVSQVPVQNRPPNQARPDFVDSDYGSRPTYGSHPSQGYQPKRRKSWLNEIFD